MQRLKHGALFLWQWLIFFPAFIVLTVLGGLFAIPAAHLGYRRWANRQVAARWARGVARCALARVQVEGREHVDPERSYVVVANHQSQFDIPLVYGWSGLDLRWVMKAELRKLPIIGAGCRALGHIIIDRGDPDAAHAAINDTLSSIPEGTGILFFPEGTRSRGDHMLPFKKGAFRAAVDRQLPILPMTVIGTRAVLPPGTARVHPGLVRLVIHPPVVTAGMGVEDVAALRNHCRQIIAKEL